MAGGVLPATVVLCVGLTAVVSHWLLTVQDVTDTAVERARSAVGWSITDSTILEAIRTSGNAHGVEILLMPSCSECSLKLFDPRVTSTSTSALLIVFQDGREAIEAVSPDFPESASVFYDSKKTLLPSNLYVTAPYRVSVDREGKILNCQVAVPVREEVPALAERQEWRRYLEDRE